VKNILIFLFRVLKNVSNNGRSAGNTVTNWREITLKNSRSLISAALKITFQKLASKLICPTFVLQPFSRKEIAGTQMSRRWGV
jgi:hypothetical protein